MHTSKSKHWPSLDTIHTLIFDFDGVFTDNKVYVDQEGKESVRCDRGDGLAIDILHRYRKKRNLSFNFFILSTERNPIVAARAKKLKLECIQNVVNKLDYVKEYLRQYHASNADAFAGLIYLGNDLNDLPVLELAGFSIAPSDAHERVRATASVVLPQLGGQGFVRAAIERLLNISGMTQEELHGIVCNR